MEKVYEGKLVAKNKSFGVVVSRFNEFISGKLLVRYEDSKGKLNKRILKKGDSFHFPPGSVHQEEAITNCEIIEASTPHLNDRVRMEKEFGLTYTSGLPSTKPDDIVIL